MLRHYFHLCLKFTVCIVLFGAFHFAQGQSLLPVKGRVVDGETEKPLPYASVFFNNTTYGATADEEGKFEFMATAGAYDMIVNFFSYQPIIFQINLDSTSRDSYVFKMYPLQYGLKEVSVEGSRDERWYHNLEVFKGNFIGKSMNAKDCKILNPEVLIIDSDPRKRTMSVRARDILIIENKALGYKINYLLENYQHDFSDGYVSFLGFPRFEEMKGSKSRVKKWKKARKRAYLGSKMHFFKSLREGRTKEEGFLMSEFKKVPNPERPTEEALDLARRKLREATRQGETLSADSHERAVLRKSSLPKFRSYITKVSLADSMMVKKQNNDQLLSFEHFVAVTYTGEDAEYAFTRSAKKVPQRTNLSLIEGETKITEIGLLENPLAVLLDGYMGWEKMADTLPIDYVLPEENK